MDDQAKALREMIENARMEREKTGKVDLISLKENRNTRFITITSGKGGVGKTNITLNLAIKLRKFGHRVTVIDADLGLSNVDVVAGILPKYSLYDVIRGEKSVVDVAEDGPAGVKIVSGGSGLLELVDLDSFQLDMLLEAFEELERVSDYILIDTGAGINSSVLKFISFASDIIVVVTPDPASITDAYALVKNIQSRENNISVIINRAESSKEAKEVYEKFTTACDRFLKRKIKKLGFILEDQNVIDSIKQQIPFILKYPNSKASRSIDLIANSIENSSEHIVEKSSFKSFLKAFVKGNS